MNLDRVGIRQPRKRSGEETTEALQLRISDMEGWMIDSSWAERFGKKPPARALNRAFMTAKAILAERNGDLAEADRLRETLNGVEGRLGVDYQQVERRRSVVAPDFGAIFGGFDIARRLRSLMEQQRQ